MNVAPTQVGLRHSQPSIPAREKSVTVAQKQEEDLLVPHKAEATVQ